jgi:predicted HTH transcriptional regulator
MKAWTTKALELLKASLEPPVALDHAMEDYESARLLFVHVPESAVKPVHLRGTGLEDAFIRSGGTTRKASRQEIGTLPRRAAFRPLQRPSGMGETIDLWFSNGEAA